MGLIDGVTTQQSREVWKSPDGKIKIFELNMDYQGKVFNAKTYSQAIATVGFTGSVESYEKEGRNGAEQFVKLPSKTPVVTQATTTTDFTMYLSYAKDLMIAMLETKGYEEKEYKKILKAVREGGELLQEPTFTEDETEIITNIDEILSKDE